MREDTKVRFYTAALLQMTFKIGEENINFYFVETCAKLLRIWKTIALKNVNCISFMMIRNMKLILISSKSMIKPLYQHSIL